MKKSIWRIILSGLFVLWAGSSGVMAKEKPVTSISNVPASAFHAKITSDESPSIAQLHFARCVEPYEEQGYAA